MLTCPIVEMNLGFILIFLTFFRCYVYMYSLFVQVQICNRNHYALSRFFDVVVKAKQKCSICLDSSRPHLHIEMSRNNEKLLLTDLAQN